MIARRSFFQELAERSLQRFFELIQSASKLNRRFVLLDHDLTFRAPVEARFDDPRRLAIDYVTAVWAGKFHGPARAGTSLSSIHRSIARFASAMVAGEPALQGTGSRKSSAAARDRVRGEGPDRVRALPGGGWPGSIPPAPMGYLTAGAPFKRSEIAQAMIDVGAAFAGFAVAIITAGAIVGSIFILFFVRA